MSARGIIFRTSNQYADVAVACRLALSILWIEFLLGNKYLMHWDRRCQDRLKYSSDVKQQPNVKALGQNCLLFAKPGEIFNLSWCWEVKVLNSHKTSTFEKHHT